VHRFKFPKAFSYVVWSGFHLSTQEMVCTENLFFSNYFWEVQKSTYCESFILGTRDGDGQH
jgi:hypothetical protein